MAARKPSERSHGGGGDDVPDLNLVPIMAIMVILIPMLIYMFTFHTIKVQQVMAPREGTGAKKTQEEKQKKPLNLTVTIKKGTGFLLQWEEDIEQSTKESPIIGLVTVDATKWCDTENDGKGMLQGCENQNGVCTCYDFPTLHTKLVEMKTRFPTTEKDEKGNPKHDPLNVTADKSVPWSIVSRTIDAATCRLTADQFGSLQEYRDARPKKGGMFKIKGLEDEVEMCEALYPRVVFALTD